eukprot:scaffold131607_cov24-Phaeocystis_antarctica.AAC.1
MPHLPRMRSGREFDAFAVFVGRGAALRAARSTGAGMLERQGRGFEGKSGNRQLDRCLKLAQQPGSSGGGRRDQKRCLGGWPELAC